MLQGSLDNFALDEVLGLLSSTSKTGRLSLKGDRGDGSLTIYNGQLVDASASYDSNGTAPEDVVFELLRYVDGNFTFDVSEVEPSESTRDIGEVLVSAEGRLADWRTIESVVPSLDHIVTPAPDLPSEEVQINRSEWTTLRIIAAGCPASLVCEQLGLGEVEGSRQIKGLAERGLVGVGPPDAKPAASTRGVDALTGSPARDPFARRSINTGSLEEDPITAAAVTTADEPFGAIGDEALLPEEGFTPAPPEPISSRPPMPTAPTIEDLQELDESGEPASLPAPPPVPMPDDHALVGGSGNGNGNGNGSGNGNGNGSADDRDAESKPGGLLMRYLKSDD